jgi:hypothetical protein
MKWDVILAVVLVWNLIEIPFQVSLGDGWSEAIAFNSSSLPTKLTN